MHKLILIGPRSVGKSTVGQALSNKLKLKYADFDKFVEKKLGDLDKYIEEKSLESYRNEESELLPEFLKTLPKKFVISIGGGTIASQYQGLSQQNADLLKTKGQFIFLNPSYERKEGSKFLYENEKKRNGNKSFKDIQKLFDIRKPIYEKYADITILTMAKTPEQVADEIISRIN